MPTTRHEAARLRCEFDALRATLDSPTTLDAENDALDALAEWARRELGPGWQPIYADLRVVGLVGARRGRQVTLLRS